MSDSALDLRRGEIAIVAPLVAVLLVLSAWPNAITGRAFAAGGESATLTAGPLFKKVTLSALPKSCVIPTKKLIFFRTEAPTPFQKRIFAFFSTHRTSGALVLAPVNGSLTCPNGGLVKIELPVLKIPVIDPTTGTEITVPTFEYDELALANPTIFYAPPVAS